MPVCDGPSCSGCGLPNYAGLCPHCRGDLDAYKRELAPFSPYRDEETGECGDDRSEAEEGERK